MASTKLYYCLSHRLYSLVPEEAKPVLLVHELGLRASCYVHLYEDDDGFHNAPPSRRSPPRPIVQTHTIKNLPPDSGLCVQIPTVIKSTAGFRHFSRSIQAQSEMEKLYFILAGKPLGSDNWWCGHVYLAEDHPPPPLADVETLISSQGGVRVGATRA